jgi:hypothetical protein
MLIHEGGGDPEFPKVQRGSMLVRLWLVLRRWATAAMCAPAICVAASDTAGELFPFCRQAREQGTATRAVV